MNNDLREEDFTPIDGSDHMNGYHYNSFSKIMTVRFKNGYQYAVHGMSPEEHQTFLDAPSQGEHYHRFIKDQHKITRTK